MSRGSTWVLGCGLVTAVGVVILLFWPLVQDLPVILAPLPGGHPAELVGKWQVQGKRYGRLMHLDADGHGLWWRERWGRPSLSWGVSGNVLVEKHGSTDAMVLQRHYYTLSPDGQVLTLTDIDYPAAAPVVFLRVK